MFGAGRLGCRFMRVCRGAGVAASDECLHRLMSAHEAMREAVADLRELATTRQRLRVVSRQGRLGNVEILHGPRRKAAPRKMSTINNIPKTLGKLLGDVRMKRGLLEAPKLKNTVGELPLVSNLASNERT